MALQEGRTAVAVVTQEFESLAKTMAANAGQSGLRIHVLPYPLESRSEQEVREIARQHFRPLLRTLGMRGELALE